MRGKSSSSAVSRLTSSFIQLPRLLPGWRHGTEGWPWYRHHLELDDAKQIEPSGKVVTALCSRFVPKSADQEAFRKGRGRAIRNPWNRTNAREATAVIHLRSHGPGILEGDGSSAHSSTGSPTCFKTTGFQDNTGFMRRCGDSFLLRFGMAVRSKKPSKSQNSRRCMKRKNRATNWLSI